VGYSESNQSNVPRADSISEKVRFSIKDVASDYDARIVAESAEAAEAMRKLSGKARGRIKRKLGAKNYRAMREFVGRERAQLRQAIEPPGVDEKEEAKIRGRSRARGKSLLKKMGVDLAELRQINDEFRASFDKLAAKRTPKATELQRPDEVPESIRTYKTNPWTIVRSFGGWQQGHRYNGSGYSGSHEHFTTASSGLAGNTTSTRNSDADDFDWGDYQIDSQIGFWYKTQSAGILEAYIEAQPSAASHYISTYDEWGWSDSNTSQNNYLMLHAIHPDISGPSFSRMSWMGRSWMGRSGSSNGSSSRTYLSLASTYFAHFYTDAPLPGGTWVYIRCGTRTMNNSWTNDVSIRSSTNFKWALRGVQIRTVP
jgi:hypothetical protein